MVLRFNVYNHQVAFLLPWLLILFFSNYELSILHKTLDTITVLIVVTFLSMFVLGSQFAQIIMYIKKSRLVNFSCSHYVHDGRYYFLFFIFVLFSLLNVLLAGYLPLVEQIIAGDPRYMDFGISGVYGIFLAFANAFGVLSYYLYIKTGKRIYIYIFYLILFIFLLFMTRQNIISLLVEIFIVHGFLCKKINLLKVLILALLVLMAFSALGELRSGDIKKIIEANPDYDWLPSSVYWLYGYFYFSGVNLDNFIIYSPAPYYDGSSFASLIPNVIKNYFNYSFEHGIFLQKINFTVSTALMRIYGDMGIFEVIILGLCFGFFTSIYYLKALSNPEDFLSIAIYSTLFFCAAFSFFVNFWFYLPIIFQIPFFIFFQKIIFKYR